jgi:bifunctional non-homologous end joining protein LigD
VKIKKSERDWLLIKERDSYVKQPGDQFDETSVLSGLTVEEVKAGRSPVNDLRSKLEATGAPRASVDPRSVSLMLAEPADMKESFTRDGWIFELKLDGYRLLASKSRGDVLLLSRNGNDYTSVFPEVAKAVRALPFEQCIVDGEVVVMDAQGKPSFSRLQQRGKLSSTIDITRAAVELPSTYYAFDLIALEGFDLRGLPLIKRKALLMETLPKLGAVHPLDHIEREGDAFLAQVEAHGLEGIVGKRADTTYRGGRSDLWLKIKAQRSGDFVIVGFTEPQGSRNYFGALQLADMVGGTLVYAGRVGTGFGEAQMAEIRAMLDPIVRRDPPCGPPIGAGAVEIPETKTTVWVEPVYVCEVRFREWTPDGILRHSAFLRLRHDKNPRDCDRQRGPSDAPWTPAPIDQAPAPPQPAPVAKTFTFSNLNKIYWPADKYTKGDLVDYYRAISPWMLPYLINRPVVMTRFPDGIDGKSFYQKDAPEFAPAWIRTIPIWAEDTQRDIKYFVCDDVESLLYIANLGSIPMHIWNSRVGSLEQPDWCVIDLDPKEAPFSDVIRTAIVLHDICESIDLPNYVKTTGKTGLHVLLPLGRQVTYAQCRTLGELLARLVLRELNDIATITRHITKRGDKVYLDYLQNRHGQLIVAPFSVRPLPGATVSMPLTWDEVNPSLDPRAFTIKTAVERMERLVRDPVAAVLEEKPDLGTVLGKLSKLLSS